MTRTNATSHDHDLSAVDAAIAAEAKARGDADSAQIVATAKLADRLAVVEADVAVMKAAKPPVTPPPVDPPPVTPPPTGGVTPPPSIDRTGAADVTSALASWLNGLPAGTLVDWNGGTFRLRQIMLEGRSLRFTGAGKLVFTTVMTGSAAGLIHMREQCHGMVFDHRGLDGKPQLLIVGPAPASDYGRSHASQEATENNHLFWCQGVQGIEIAGITAYGAGGDAFYSGGWTAKGGQWTHDLYVHDCAFSAMGRMFGALADGGTNVTVRNNVFGKPIPGTLIDSLAKAGPGWNGVIIEPNDVAVADGSAYGYGNVLVEGNAFGRAYHPGGVSGGITSATAVKGNTKSKLSPPFIWRDNSSDAAYPWKFVDSYGNAQSVNNK